MEFRIFTEPHQGASYEDLLAVALVLTVTKAVVWWMSGSVALLASMADSLLDLTASVTVYFAVRYAAEPADAEHRFGHGKAEARQPVVVDDIVERVARMCRRTLASTSSILSRVSRIGVVGSNETTGPLIEESQNSFESIKEEFAIENINRLTALCGELLGATCALYNRLDNRAPPNWDHHRSD